jgi:hypothetical protein
MANEMTPSVNATVDIPHLYSPEYSKFLELRQDCQKQNAEILATIENLSTLEQWNALYETHLWRIKLEYAIAMMERYGHVNIKIKQTTRQLPKLVYRLVTPSSENNNEGEPIEEDQPQKDEANRGKRTRQRKAKCIGGECIVPKENVRCPVGSFDRFDAYAVDELL